MAALPLLRCIVGCSLLNAAGDLSASAPSANDLAGAAFCIGHRSLDGEPPIVVIDDDEQERLLGWVPAQAATLPLGALVDRGRQLATS